MANYVEDIRQTLADLVAQREHIDADIADLRRIINRHAREGMSEAEQSTTPAATAQSDEPFPERPRGVVAGRGQARREILDLMSDGKRWMPADIASKRGTTRNAAAASIKRLLAEEPPIIRRAGNGYVLASDDDAQTSLPPYEREEAQPEVAEGVDDDSGGGDDLRP